jgi:hypothetical protein
MNIATFQEKFPKFYHKIEREKKTSTPTFYFPWFVLIL